MAPIANPYANVGRDAQREHEQTLRREKLIADAVAAGKAKAKAEAAAREAARLAAVYAKARERDKAADQARRIKAANAVMLAQVGGRRINAAAPSDLTRADSKRMFGATWGTLTGAEQKRLTPPIEAAFDSLTPAPKTVKDALKKIEDQVSGKVRPSVVIQFDKIIDESEETALAVLVWNLAVARDFAESGAAIDALIAFLKTFAAAHQSA